MAQNPFDSLLREPSPSLEPGRPAFEADNPFDRIVRTPEIDQERRMRAARQSVEETSPDRRAQAMQLATETGLPVDVVERNFETLSRRRAAARTSYTAMQQQAPALSEWVTNPDNAAIAKDDMEPLGNIEWILKAPSRAFAQQINRGRYADLRVKSLFRSLTQEEQDQLNAYQFHSDVGGELGVGDSFFRQAVTGAGRLLAQTIMPAKYGVIGGLEGLVIGGAVGSVVPGVGTAAGALATAQYTARAGLMYGVFKSAATQETAFAYDDIVAMKDETGRTIDPDVARIAALTVGGLNGLVEQVGLEAFLKRFPGLDKLSKGMGRDAMKQALRNPTVRAGFARLAKSYAGGLSTEVATEVAQRAIAIAGEELSIAASDTSLASRTPVQAWDELVLEAVHAVPEFAFGMLPGPVLGLARDAGRAKQAEQGVAFFTALGEGVAQSKTATRMPAAFQQLVADATKEGPVADVYAPVDTWRTYWQEQGQDPAAMAAEITGRADALDVAERTGNLRIPTAAYAARLAGSEHNQFFTNELRLGSPDAFNGREMVEFQDRVEQARQRVQDALKAETPEAQQLRALQTSIESQLVETGVPRGTAATMAEGLAGIGEMAQRAGFDPASVFETYGLTVARRPAAEAPAAAGGTIIEQADPGADQEDIPGLAALEASLGGATVETVDPSTGLTLNASGESAASLEALSRQEGMQGRGEQFVVYDRAGRRKPLLGPDAVDYRPHQGETYGVEDASGFRVLDDRGGRAPSQAAVESRLGQNVASILGQKAPLPAVRTGQRVEGEPGPANAAGVRAVFVGYQEGFGSMPTMPLYNVLGGERHGSTVGADDLREMGIELPETPPLLEFNQRAIANTPALRAWFGNSAVVDEEGQPLVVYHGTTQVFSSFERERANIESDFGAGFYFSNNPDDVAENYATVGPDLANKIERRAEQIEREIEDTEADLDALTDEEFAAMPARSERARQQARAEFVAQEGMTIPVFLKIENPAVLGGPNETRFTFEMEQDEEGELTGEESGTFIDFAAALRTAAAGYTDGDVKPVIGKLATAALDGDLSLSRAIEIYRADEDTNYFIDENGDLAGFEIFRQALEGAGFDGIIDYTVDVKFGSQRRIGKAMAGMNEDTVHYIVFQPTQIKSAMFNRGTFDPVNPDILFQSAADPAPAQAAFYSRLDRAVQESKLAKATGGQWRATIRNSRVGVNKDEFAIARIEDLDEKTVYTRDEILAYLKQNRPRVNLVVLEGQAEIDEDALRERADEIFDRMVEEAENEVDWDDYLGTADVIEETETREVERLDENGDPVLDEDGDPIIDEEEVSVYYPAVSGGYRPRGYRDGRRLYGVEPRRGSELIEDAEAYDDYDDAERAAERYLRDVDREPYYEMVSEGVRENIDYADAEREAREEMENEPEHQVSGRYSGYVLEPAAEEDTYQEIFITAGQVAKPAEQPPAEPIAFDAMARRIYGADTNIDELSEEQRRKVDEIRLQDVTDPDVLSQAFYNVPYAQATAGQRAQIDIDLRRSAQAAGGTRQGGAFYAWKDGHDLYNDIENPIVRIRLNIRRTVPTEPAARPEYDQALTERAQAALKELEPLKNQRTNFARFENIPPLTAAQEQRLDELERVVEDYRAMIRRVDQERRDIDRGAMGERVLFLEEVQPPRPEEQPKMPPIFVKHWREIAFKWALKHAADLGVHAVAWTTGAQQADRYSLRRKVHKIEYSPTPELTSEGIPTPAYLSGSRHHVVVDLKDSPTLVMQADEQGIVRVIINDSYGRWSQLKGQPLAAVLGDEIAAEILEKREGTIEGKGLLVGGEGLKKLYDYDFRNIVNALPAVKKNGGKVGTVNIHVKGEYEIQEDERRIEPTQMAQAMVEGQPDTSTVYRVMLEEKVVAEFPDRDAAWTYIRENRDVVSPQPALIMTPQLVDAVNGGQALFQAARWRPLSSSEVESMQEQVNAVVDQAIAEAPAGSALAVMMTPGGELHIDGISVPATEQGKGAGSKMLRKLAEWADQHNIQMSLVQAADEGREADLLRFYKRLGFVKNGGRFYDASSYGTWVRPAKDDTPARRRQMQRAAGKPPRGMIQFQPNRQTQITLFETADLSTFLHETGHFYLEVMGDLVDRLEELDPATLTPQQQQFRADYATILNHLGITARNEIGVEQHELFARSFEAYLMEGRAPSLRLREAFARFRAWLLGIYRSLKALNAPLTDDVRKVFDRMLASDEAIAEAEAAGQMAPMFTTPESAGMSHERFALYRQAIDDASRTARERLEQQLVAEVQREQTAQWKQRREEVRALVERETHAQPVYRAIAAMTRGTNPDGSPLVEGEKPVPMRLSKAMIVATFGPERLRGLPKRAYSAQGGIDPQVVADLFGFSSGDEMLSAVAAAQPMQKQIVQETDRRMLLEHGSLLLDGTLHEQAQAAVANEHREIVIREELRALARMQQQTRRAEEFGRREEREERAYERRWFEAEARLRIAIAEGRQQAVIDRLQAEVNKLKTVARTGPATVRGSLPSSQMLREQAQQLIASTKVRDLRPNEYWSAARRASQAAVEAAARQDFDAAILAKHQELISLALYRETVRAKEDVEARVQKARQVGKPQSMARLQLAGETYHDQVAGVLDRFDFAKVPQRALDRRAALWKWVQGQEAQGIAVDVPDILVDEAKRVNYQDLTVEELVGVTDGLAHLVHLARFKDRLLKSAGRRRLKAVAKELSDSIRAHRAPRKKGRRDRPAGTERLRAVMGVLAAHRKLASLLREMDGFQDGGPMWNAIMRPLNEAGAREAEMNAAATRRFAELVETAYPRASKRQLYVKAWMPAVNDSLSKMERIVIALNWGNEGNRDRIRRAEGWSDEQVQAVLDTLDERDAKFVQGIFDFIGSYWDQIAAKQERVTGVRPEKVEAVGFRIGGTTLRGGYYPLKYDDRLSAKAAGQLDLEGANLAKLAALAHPTTKRGHTKARQATLDQPVRWDFGVMFEHVAAVIHDLSHHETLIDVGRVLGHNDVQQAIIDTHGDIVFKTIKNTIRDVALGDQPAVGAFEKALNHTRIGATIVGLGWSLSVATLQPLGLANSVVRIGPAAVARGISRLLGSPARMNATLEWVYEQSTFMKTRGLTQQRELNEIRNKVGVYSGKFSGIADEMLAKSTFDLVTRQGIADSYFYFIQQMQRIVDVPTWLGAYDKAMRDGKDEGTAAALADQAVLDSQGGGQVKDLAGVQRGGPAAKLFTNFYSYFSVVYNQAVESGKAAASTREPWAIGRAAVDYMMLFIVPATLGYFIREGLRPGDDDEGLAEALIVENITYMMGLVVGLREFGGAVGGFEYQGPAGARVFSAGSRAIQQARQGELDEAALRATNEFLGLLFHYPASQAWRTGSGIAAIAEGKTENPFAVIMGPERK